MNSAAKLAIGLFVGAVVYKTVANTQTAVNSASAAEAPMAVETQAGREANVLSATKNICKGAEARAKRIAKAHSDWKAPGVALVACHRYAIGMTEDMLVASLGNPSAINKTQTVDGSHEQWVYGDDYMYVDNGALTSFQTSR